MDREVEANPAREAQRELSGRLVPQSPDQPRGYQTAPGGRGDDVGPGPGQGEAGPEAHGLRPDRRIGSDDRVDDPGAPVADRTRRVIDDPQVEPAEEVASEVRELTPQCRQCRQEGPRYQ